MNPTLGLVRSLTGAALPKPRVSLTLCSNARSTGVIRCEGDSGTQSVSNGARVATSRRGDEAVFVATKTTSRRGNDLVEEVSRRPDVADAIANRNGDAAMAESPMEKEAWALLREAVVTYCGQPVGTIAANDPTDPFPLNYDQVFIRDFIPSAIAFLLKGEYDIVRNFLHHTLQLQVSSSHSRLQPNCCSSLIR